MTDQLFPLTMDELIACVEREIRLRQQVYPRRVADKRMSQAKADREIEMMGAVLKCLRWMKEFA
jgi:hypothetical protein